MHGEKDLSSRDVVSRAEAVERSGRGAGSARKRITFTFTSSICRGVLDARLPGIVQSARTFAGVDAHKEPIPVIPTVHYGDGRHSDEHQAEVIIRRRTTPRQSCRD